MRILYASLNFLFLSALAACSTATPYQPADKSDNGYSDQKISEGRYRVSFKGNDMTSRETVELYLLYRAAEITVAEQYDFFVVYDKETTADVRYDNVQPAVYGAYGGYRRWGTGLSWNQTVQTSTDYSAMFFINLYKGEPPANDPRAYKAQEVLTNIGPKIKRPKAKKG